MGTDEALATSLRVRREVASLFWQGRGGWQIAKGKLSAVLSNPKGGSDGHG
jgi:hypothetical protein